MWLAFAALIGALGVYLIVRPMLHAVPRFKAFYAQADTFWQKAWALAYRSATIVASYAGALIGLAMSYLEPAAAMVGDPTFQEQVKRVVGADTKLAGGVLIAFSIIVFASRMRSIIKGV